MTTRLALAGQGTLINTKGGARTVIKARFVDNGESITLWGSATDAKMLAVSNGEKIIVDVIEPHPMKAAGTVTYKFKSTKIAADLAAQAPRYQREMLTAGELLDPTKSAVAPAEDTWQLNLSEILAARAARSLVVA